MKHGSRWCMYMDVHKERGKWAINACKNNPIKVQ